MSVYYHPSETIGWIGTQPTRVDPLGCVTVSIVSNSRIMGEGLTNLLHSHLNISGVNKYDGGDIVAAEASAIPFEDHVVLIDCGLGIEPAVAWTRFWRDREPSAHVIIIELADDCDNEATYTKAGANGYAIRGATISELAATIQTARRGATTRTADTGNHLFTRMARIRATSASSPITPRELEVLACVSNGMSNQEIANKLVIEVRTVKHHLHNILDKLQVRSRWQAVRVARERNWIPTQRAIRA